MYQLGHELSPGVHVSVAVSTSSAEADSSRESWVTMSSFRSLRMLLGCAQHADTAYARQRCSLKTYQELDGLVASTC